MHLSSVDIQIITARGRTATAKVKWLTPRGRAWVAKNMALKFSDVSHVSIANDTTSEFARKLEDEGLSVEIR